MIYADADPERHSKVSRAIERECDAVSVACGSDPDRILDRVDDSSVACLVCADRVDGATSVEFVARVREVRPDLSVIVFTGEDPATVGGDLLAAGATDVLHNTDEPFRYELLAAKVRRAASQYREREPEVQRPPRDLATYETIVATAPEPIYRLDADRRFGAVNPAMVELTGYALETLLDADLTLVMDEDDAASVETAVEGLVTGEHDGGPIEVEVITAGGKRRSCLVTLSVLPFDERFRGSVGILRDVTERRRREQRLEVMDRVLRHNLRNQINVVRGRARFLEDRLQPEAAEHVAQITDSMESLLSVSEKVRWANSVFRDGDDLGAIDVAVVAERAVERARERFPDPEFRVETPGNARVSAHRAVRICVDELLENAVRHNAGSTPTVEVTVEPRGFGMGIVVGDDGPGLPDHERRILEGARESQLNHGSGVGLWLVRWIVDESGGQIHATAPDDGGTEITVVLPEATG